MLLHLANAPPTLITLNRSFIEGLKESCMESMLVAPKRDAKTVVTVESGDFVLEITIAAYRKDGPSDKPLVVLK
jgi:hypothetical protein